VFTLILSLLLFTTFLICLHKIPAVLIHLTTYHMLLKVILAADDDDYLYGFIQMTLIRQLACLWCILYYNGLIINNGSQKTQLYL